MDLFRLEIITKIDRNQAITIVKDMISTAGGWILDHHLFSNTSASLGFEVPYSSIESLMAGLKEGGLNPTIVTDCPRDKDGEVRGGVALIFIHNEPDLKRDVPHFG